MINRNTLTAIALATTCLTPLAAFAQAAGSNAATPPAGATAAPPSSNSDSFGALPFSGEVGLGVMGVMGKNPDQAGRYTGLTTKGVDAVGQFDLHGASPWDSGGTKYLDLTGDNLIFQGGHDLGSGNDQSSYSRYNSSTNNNVANSGTVRLDLGNQGTWSAGGYFDSISYTGNTIDSIYTVNQGQGRLNNLPAWGGSTPTHEGNSAFTVPQLLAAGALQPVQTGTRRDIFGSDGKYIWGDWTFTAAVRHEHKEGSMEEALDLKYGGTAFALPINYDTDRYDVAATYNNRVNQMVLQYTYSKFVDRNTFVALPQVVAMTTVPFQETAAYSTPPSSDAHYVTLMAATNAVPKTRMNVNLRVGYELQDATFAPDTQDPSLVGVASNLNSNLQGTSANSLNAQALVYQGKISADSHPIENTDARVFYGFDGRNVHIDQYEVFTGSTGGSGDASFNNAQFVVPQNWMKQNAGAEVGYHIIPQSDTKLTVGYRFDVVERNNANVDHSTTNTETVALSSKLGPQVHSSLSYEHGDRSASLNYVVPWANLAGVPTTSGSSGVTFSGAYYQAPMTSDAIRFRTDYAVADNMSAGMFIQFKNENYNYPVPTLVNSGTISGYPITGGGEGVKQDYNLTVGPDLSYRPTDDLNLHLFYTYEQIYYNNLGNGACSTAAQAATAACTGTAGYFQNQYTSAVNTAGISGDWKVSDKLKLGAEYTFAYGSVMFGQFDGVFVSNPTVSNQNVTNYPDIDSLMNNIKLTAGYELAPSLELIAQCGWTYFHNNNWNDTAGPVQGAGSTTISYLTPGYGSPNYSTVTLMTGVKFKF